MAFTGSNSSVQDADAAVTHADIVVALTSFNDAETIGSVVQALQDGLAQSFVSSTVQFVLADAGSTDRTRDVVREMVGLSSLVEVDYERGANFDELPYHGYPGRAGALRAILQTAQRINAKGCAVIDANLQTVEPHWIERLIAPVLSDGFDYVSPYYVRHVNEGAITRGIVYPTFRALYGVRLRQPVASEFGCSPRMVAHLIEQDFWDAQHASVGIDLWLAAAAVSGKFRTCEAVLGRRGAASRRTTADLTTSLAQVLGALFADLEQRVDIWQRVRGSITVPVFGSLPAVEPSAPSLNVDELVQAFRLGYRELREIWTWVLPPRTLVELRKLTETASDRFRFDDRLWASIVYDFALGDSLQVMPRDHLRRSLTPLYSGWLASFVLQMRGATPTGIEERVEQVCMGFESEKRYLISRWRWPERLR
jgi:glycosyltransferase involved in cell wall biosynthesis